MPDFVIPNLSAAQRRPLLNMQLEIIGYTAVPDH